MSKERNKYKPYSNLLEMSVVGLCVAPVWPILVPPISVAVFLNEITDYAIRKDKEYEIKQKMIENEGKNR